MNLTFDRKAFATAFTIAATAAPTRTVKEVLTYVLLSVTDGLVTLRATDSEVGVEVTIPDVEVTGTGQTLLPTSRVQQILRETRSETIEVTTRDEELQISTGSSEFRLKAPAPQDFPQRNDISTAKPFRVSESALRRSMQRTVFACDVESTRYALGGVCFDHDPGTKTLWLAATDSRRMAVSGVNYGDSPDHWPSIPPVVPKRAIDLLLSILKVEDGEVSFSVNNNTAQFTLGTTIVTTQLVEGRFPPWRKVIPGQSATTAATVVGPLARAVRQAAITAVDGEGTAGVDFAFRKDSLRLSSGKADLGSSKVELPIEYSGENLTICIVPRYVLDYLKVLDDEKSLVIGLTDGESAALLQTQDGYRYVVMPLSKDKV